MLLVFFIKTKIIFSFFLFVSNKYGQSLKKCKLT
nr:MAG TPA: hypothetical protein [Caudoviricetes sp.]